MDAINHVYAAHEIIFDLVDHYPHSESLDIAMEGLEQAWQQLRKLQR